jgi:hypothetical protein
MSAALASTGARFRARSLATLACCAVASLGCMTDIASADEAAVDPSPRTLAAAVTKNIWQLGAASPASAPAPLTSPGSVTSAFRTIDNTAASMDGLDIILNPVDPVRSYLGTYHVNAGGNRFALRLATSRDLKTWRKLADLDVRGGGMGTLRALPGGAFLLAYEAQEPTAADGDIDSSVRLRYYRDPAALVSGVPTDERTLPRQLSTTNEGTPDFRSVVWNGSLANSVITLGFHYLDHGTSRKPRTKAVDREGRGTLAGDRWTSVRDTAVDRAMTRLGFNGNHGGRRQFVAPDGRSWRVYEAQRYFNVWGSWRLLLYDTTTHTWKVLRLKTPGGSKSFANPTISMVPSPKRLAGKALVMTMFVPSAGAAPGESGEAVAWLDL